MAVTFAITGTEQLEARLRRMGKLDAVKDLVHDAARLGHERVQEYARPHPVDTGGLAQGITVQFRELEALVTPGRRVVGIAYTVEEGRRPGRRPPKAAIARWATRHGIGTPPWVLATRIAKEGTRGVHMFERAAKDVERYIAGHLEQAGVRLVER